jgi:hypothetical protein
MTRLHRSAGGAATGIDARAANSGGSEPPHKLPRCILQTISTPGEEPLAWKGCGSSREWVICKPRRSKVPARSDFTNERLHSPMQPKKNPGSRRTAPSTPGRSPGCLERATRQRGSVAPHDQQKSNAGGFSSLHLSQTIAGPVLLERRNSSITERARAASSGSSTHNWGSEKSIGISPARLEAFALKIRARMPRAASRSARRWASGRLDAV